MKIPYLSSGGFEHSWLKSYAETALVFLINEKVEISKSGSQGGYLSVFQPNQDNPPKMEYLIACGIFPFEKYGSYMYNSIEKAVRLNNNIYRLGHKTSGQSANEKKQEYPGSVYSEEEKRIFSFSGLKPEWDEFISVLESCFSYYLNNQSRYPKYTDLEEVPQVFETRSGIISASIKQKEVMFATINHVVAIEIKNKERK
jgi:hypothetical protein